MVEEKWDDLFPNAAKDKAVRDTKAYEFAQLYLVFEQHPLAKQLLAHWEAAEAARLLTPTTSHSEFAYWEGRRAFIRGIRQQIDLAKNPPSGALPVIPQATRTSK